MASPDTGGDHDDADSGSVGDDPTPIRDALQQALDAEDTDTTQYHLRETLQLLHIEDNDELVRLIRKALNAEETDTAAFFIREALELHRIETMVAATTQTDSDKRAK